jgi:PIF1-like helicase
LQKTFKAKSKIDRTHIDNTVSDFCLNEEQERAFRIVANHSVDPTSEQLLMHLGGMAGTGKSQVIKALTNFFERKNQPHLFLIMAPTGSAAALVDGSTYHSVLGINGNYASESLATMGSIRARIEHVEYVFLDEISMVDCGSLYTISAQMCMALQIEDKAFGGKNMIFAGDFAQLPPPGVCPPLYSHNVSTVLHTTNSPTAQKWTLGKALWHQVTVVVILRKNMRQKNQSAGDAKFRTTLENMRYKSCTDDDIELLHSRIAGPGPNQPKLSDPQFRHVSVITARNIHQDKINEMGSVKFANDHGEKLTNFYSVDKWKSTDNTKSAKKSIKQQIDPLRSSNNRKSSREIMEFASQCIKKSSRSVVSMYQNECHD